MLKQFGEDTVIEEGIVVAIKATAPRAYLGMGLKKLAPVLKNPDLAKK